MIPQDKSVMNSLKLAIDLLPAVCRWPPAQDLGAEPDRFSAFWLRSSVGAEPEPIQASI
jgi:hypothetical protein